jgi:hypothetical protein
MIDQQRLFDALTVRLGEPASRGQVLRWLGRFALALVVFGIAPWSAKGQDEASSESALVKGCKLPGQKCKGNKSCCSRKCGGSKRCGCVKKGSKPLVVTPLGAVPIKALCCSNNVNKRTEECR